MARGMDDCIGKRRHNLVKRLSKQYSGLKLARKPSSHPTPTVGFCYLYIEWPYKLPWGREHEKKHMQSCSITSLTSMGHGRLLSVSRDQTLLRKLHQLQFSSLQIQQPAAGSRLPNYVKPFTDRLTMALSLFSKITFTSSKQSRKKTKQSSRRRM